MKNGCVNCNWCGRTINGEQKMADWLHVEKSWGYFSRRDGENHAFDLCEDCYEKLLRQFKYPVNLQNQREYV